MESEKLKMSLGLMHAGEEKNLPLKIEGLFELVFDFGSLCVSDGQSAPNESVCVCVCVSASETDARNNCSYRAIMADFFVFWKTENKNGEFAFG